MFKSRALWSAVLVGGLMVVGCDDTSKTETPATPPTTVKPPAAKTETPATPEMKTPDLTNITGGVNAATQTAATQASGTMGEAQALIAQLQKEVADKKWTDAKATLAKLDGMKDKLSADAKKIIEPLRTAIQAGDMSSLMPK